MDLLPRAPTMEDIVMDRQNRVAQYLDVRGDPSAVLPFEIVSLMLPTPPHAAQLDEDDEDGARNWLGGSLTRANLREAMASAHVAVTEVDYLQLACLLEHRHLAALIIDRALKPISLAPSPKSLLPSPLYIAVLFKQRPNTDDGPSLGSMPLVEALLTRHVDPNGLDHWTRAKAPHSSAGATAIAHAMPVVSPMHIAILHDHVAIVTALLQCGALHVSSPSLQEMRGLLMACALSCSISCLLLLRRGREALVDRLVQQPLDAQSGRTLLHYAVLATLQPETLVDWDKLGDLDDRRDNFCRLLVALGCPVDAGARDLRNDTALHLAWKCGRGRLCRMLVEELDADPSLLNDDGSLPFECHALGLSSAAIVLYGGACGVVQDSGPLSSLGYLSFLLSAVYPRCCAPSTTTAAEPPSGVRCASDAALYASLLDTTSKRDGRHALHCLCGSRFLMQHTRDVELNTVATQLCTFVRDTWFRQPTTQAAFSDLWTNGPTMAASSEASQRRPMTPLLMALDNRCSVAFAQVLLRFGADPLLIPPTPPPPFGEEAAHHHRLTLPGVNAFQLLAGISTPFPHIGDMAMQLFLHSAPSITNNKDAVPTTELTPGLEVLHSMVTHPTLPHGSMLDLPLVQTHPYWQPFYEVLRPPHSEVLRRHQEAQRFFAFAKGSVNRLIAEIEPIPPSQHGEAAFISIPTPLLAAEGGTTISSPSLQGAYVVTLHHHHRNPPQGHDTAADENDCSELPTKASLMQRSFDASFQQRVGAIMDLVNNSQLSHRNFFYEQSDCSKPLPQADPRPSDAEAAAAEAGVSLERWIESCPPGSLLQSFLLARCYEWIELLSTQTDGDTTWEAILTHQKTRHLACLRHVDHLLTEEHARSHQLMGPLGECLV